MNFFVMLNDHRGNITPLVDDCDMVLMFDSHDDAKAAAHDNMLGRTYGASIFNALEGADV